MVKQTIEIDYYSDILCVWAYVAQIRVDEIKKEFGDQVHFNYRFFSLFGDTQTRIGQGWSEKGGFSGFYKHVAKVCEGHQHLSLNPSLWSETCRPLSSAPAHLMIQTVDILLQQDSSLEEKNNSDRSILEQYICEVRRAFFEQGLNIGEQKILFDIASKLGLNTNDMQSILDSGQALAKHSQQNEDRYTKKLEGSPTFVLDQGRQKLYGNVGYRVIEANIQELFNRKELNMSWC